MRSKFLKNLQWKKKLKRLGALGLCALLIAGNLTIPDVAKAASPKATYPGPDPEKSETTIENALTYFQYMTSGDCTIGQHTVGAIAVGGTFEMIGYNTFGDGAQTASYAYNIKKATAPNLASGFPGVCNDVYYKMTEMSGDQLAGFTQNENYMNISAIYGTIQSEATSMANSGTILDAVENMQGNISGKAIVVDFTGDKGTNGYTIPYEVLKNADFIDIKLDNIRDLVDKKCVINITGMSSFSESDTFEMYSGAKATEVTKDEPLKVGVLFNSEATPALFKMGDDANKNGQFFMEGMKLIFNVPDYNGTLHTKCFAGHIVAPNANVIPGGGTLEGGVIAREVFVDDSANGDENSAEAHYYPYNSPTPHYGCLGRDVNADPTQVVCDAIFINKIYMNADGTKVPLEQCPPAGQGAKFTLYEANQDGTTGKVVVDDVEAVLYGEQHQVHILGSYLEVGGHYVLVEKTAAQGYAKSDEKFYCRVDNRGDIYYDVNYGDGGNRLTPECENTKLATPVGALEVTVKEAGSDNLVSEIEVTLKNGETTVAIVTTKDGIANFTNLETGNDYTVSIPAANPGYETLTAGSESQTVEITADTTTEKTFELEKKEEQKGSITVTVKNDKTNEAFAGLTVSVKKDGQVSKAGVTDEVEGQVTFGELEAGTYTVEIPTSIDGFEAVDDKYSADITLDANGMDKKYEFLLEPTEGSILVTVKDKDTSEPLESVNVSITDENDNPVNIGTQGTTTDSNGQVLFDGLLPGKYKVSIPDSPDGYIESENIVTLTVTAGEEEEHTFELEKEPETGSIIVEVKKNSSTGDGMNEVEVTVTSQDDASKTYTKQTSNGGTVTFDNLTPGDYWVRTTDKDGYTVTGENPINAAVNAGQDTHAEFVLQQNGTIKIAVTSGGTGVEGVEVEVTPYPGTGESKPYTTDENGNITITDVAPENYTVTVKDKDGYTIVSENPQTSTVTAGGESTYNFVLQSATLKVVVKDEKGAGVPDITVQAKKKNKYGYYADVVWESTTNESGSAECPAIVPGEYNISVKLGNGSEYTSVAGNSSKSMTLEPGANTAELVIAKTAALKIQVIDVTTTGELVNSPIPVNLSKDSSSFGSYSITGETSNPTIPRVSAGTYTAELDWIEMMDDSEYIYYVDRNASVEIDPYSKQEYVLQLYVAKKGSVNVLVKENGNPVGGQSVELTILDKEGNELDYGVNGTTESDGKETLPNVPMGNYKVTIERNVGGVTRIETQYGTLSDPNTPGEIVFDLQTQDDPNQGKIQIRVWNNKSPKELLNRVPVTITGPSNYHNQIESSSAGYVEVAGLEPGDYTVTVGEVNNYVRIDTEEDTQNVAAGSTVTYDFILDRRCTLEVEVLDKSTGLPVSGAEVSISTETTKIIDAEETTANENIKVTKLKNEKYLVEIKAPTGYAVYDVDSKKIELNPYGPHSESEPHKVQFYVVKTGTITVNVKEVDDAGRPVDDVEVKLQVEQNDGTYMDYDTAKKTENGLVTFESVPEGNYKVVIPENNTGYATLVNAENQKNVSITSGNTTANETFYLTPAGKIVIKILDEDGDVIQDDFEVVISGEHVGYIGEFTVTDGETEVTGLSPDSYIVTVKGKEGYKLISPSNVITKTVTSGTPETYEFAFSKCADLSVTIVDVTTGAPIEQDVEMYAYYDGQTKGASVKVEDGHVIIEDLVAGDYITEINVPAGYILLSEDGNSVKTVIDPNNVPQNGFYEVVFEVVKVGTVEVDVKENNANGAPVDGVKVTLYLDKGNHNYEIFGSEKTTGANGIVTFTDVPVRDYKVVISKENDGYEDLTDAECTKEGAFDQNLEAKESFYLTPEQTTPNTGSLKVTVVEKGTTTGIDGVTVTVVDSKGGTHTADTNGNGQASFNNLPIGSCVITIPATVDGYETLTGNANKDTTVVIEGNVEKTSKFELVPEKTADLTITVTDEKTNEPVPGAKVKITKKAPANGTSNQDESEVKETGNDGRIVMKGLRKGKYTTTVVSVPEGYNVTTDKEVVVDIDPANAPEAQVDYKVGQVGALKVTITEKGTTNGIYGVQVAITTNASGTENTVYTYTDANGQVNLGGQKVGSYKISIPTSIAGYKELDAAYVVQTKDVEANKTTEYAFEVEKLTTTDPNKGEAEIIVKDEVTGNPVPGASVIVTAPDNTKRKYTTDGNGRITIPQQDPGDYKVEVIEVPEGYTVTQNKQTTITVVAGATEKAEIMVKPAEGNSGVGGSEVEPPTVGSGQGEADTTPDNNGGAVNTGGTSDNTGDVVNTGGATDSNNGGVITTGQTAGATNNKTTDAQSVSKQPKTGDETNPGIIWIILSVSACLAAASVIGLVYVKKKED